MRIIVLIGKLKKVTAVAEALNMKQPTVSFHLKKLEEEWGAKLFELKAGKVLFTEAGRLLHYYAQQIVSSSDEAERRMQELNTTSRNRLVIGCPDVVSQTLFDRRWFEETSANLTKEFAIAVQTGEPGYLMERMLAGEIDLVLSAKAGLLKGQAYTEEMEYRGKLLVVHSEQLVQIPLSLLLPATHPLMGVESVRPSDIAHYPAIALGEPSIQAAVAQWEADVQLSLRPIMELDQTSLVIKAVVEGMGIAIVPERITAQESGLVTLPLPGDAPPWSIIASWGHHHWNPPLLRKAIDLLKP
ncbi:LysR family transcriptional regulator [Paenibacillus sp. GCM10012307]